jgi:two-component system chemotaxis sensor kinase CheA
VAPVTIRVDLDRVDRLINVVGELVIQQAMLAQRVMESGLARSSDIALGLEDLELLTRDIQDSVMAIRAQPVKSVFQRMPRLVREVADMTGKRVRLVTSGEDTEVDKTVVERLAEPITHMLRNAIDHGLESPEEREAAGKPAEGTVRLAALHRSGRIVIEIADDGKGINRPRVRGIAVARGLIAEDAVLTDDEVDNLIFLPGFSTAETVTDVSGRGVGMDVVKRSIQALGGRISISSVPGKGSTFTLSLPLTLAVLDGMVVSAAEQTLVAPLSAIVESLTPQVSDIHHVGGHDAVIRFREEFVPLVDVARVMGFRDGAADLVNGVVMIVETEAGSRAALLVDAINGQRQVVIKSLETNYRHVDGVSAATLLGDGSVALILDIDALVIAGRRKSNRPELKMAS